MKVGGHRGTEYTLLRVRTATSVPQITASSLWKQEIDVQILKGNLLVKAGNITYIKTTTTLSKYLT